MSKRSPSPTPLSDDSKRQTMGTQDSTLLPPTDSAAPSEPAPSPPLPTSTEQPPLPDPATDTPAAPLPPAESGSEERRRLASPALTDDKIEDDDDEIASKRDGVKLSSLNPVRVAYEDNTLQGFDDPSENAYPYSKELNDKVYIWKGDITSLEVDCIVNAANKSLLGGGGVDGAIHSAAGPSLYRECKTLDGAETGETKLTGGHRLPAKHIAHTVGPIYGRSKKQESEDLLRSCYKATLDLCVENGIRSVAFSGISTGVYGYPLDAAAEVACHEVRKFLEGPDGDKIDAVLFVVFRPIDVNSYLDNLPAYFPPPPSSDGDKKDDGAAVDAATAPPAAATKGDDAGADGDEALKVFEKLQKDVGM